MEDLLLSPRQHLGMASPNGFSVDGNFPGLVLELKRVVWTREVSTHPSKSSLFSRLRSFPARTVGTLHSSSELEPLNRLNHSHKVLARQSQIHWLPFRRKYWRDTSGSMVSPDNSVRLLKKRNSDFSLPRSLKAFGWT